MADASFSISAPHDRDFRCCRRMLILCVVGANLGGSDGVDVWGSNHWIHDVEVTNRDECVTVKVCPRFAVGITLLSH